MLMNIEQKTILLPLIPIIVLGSFAKWVLPRFNRIYDEMLHERSLPAAYEIFDQFVQYGWVTLGIFFAAVIANRRYKHKSIKTVFIIFIITMIIGFVCLLIPIPYLRYS